MDSEIFKFSYFEVIFLWRLSSIGACLHRNLFFTLVWSHERMFKIWGRSHQWLLRYSNFHIFKSSSIRGHLALKVVFMIFFLLWFVPLSLCLHFEENSISGCWDIQIFIFWGHLPLGVVFPWRLSSIEGCLHYNLSWLWFGPMSSCLKF